jgi:hypothetical protein
MTAPQAHAMSLGLHEVEPGRRAAVALDAVQVSRSGWQRQHRRPPALTAREALAALQFECLIVWTAAASLRAGAELQEDDFERLTLAQRRIDAIAGEVNP